MKCLIPNIGSTSFKFRLLDMPGETVLAAGRVERIGQPGGECADYPAAIRKCIASIVGEGKALASLAEIDAVGFKAVHAGANSASRRSIGEELLAAMEEFSFLCPAHNPPYIAAMRAFRKELPGVPLVAVIETGPYRWHEMRPRPPTRFRTSGGPSMESGAMDFTAPAIARRAKGPRHCWAATICAISRVIWAAVRASRRFATASPSIRALALRRSRACRRTIASATSMSSPFCT